MKPEKPTTLKRGDEIEVEISSAAFSAGGEAFSQGKSVARINGFVVFVEGAVPGDIVRARIVRIQKSFAEARTLEVVRPSSVRTSPRCIHFGVCGGCKWQHVRYEAQLQFKQQHVVDAFRHIGGFSTPPVLPIIGCREPYFYRNKMEFSFSDQEWQQNGPAGDSSPLASPVYLGLHVPQRYDKVLDIRECHLQSELSNEILRFTREFARRQELPVYSSRSHSGYWRFLVIRQSRRTQEVMVNLVTFDDRPEVMRRFAEELLSKVPGITTIVNTINTRKAQIAYGEQVNVYHGSGVIHERLGRLVFEISAGSFFQTNTDQAETLYGITRSFAALKPSDIVFDLYSGTGSIALFVADAAKKVVGIESAESAVNDALRNAQLNAVANCTFIQGDLKERLTTDDEWKERYPHPDVIIIDPPRSGMHPKVVEEVVALNAERIVYVSCNPATQARDVKIMCGGLSGGTRYELLKLQPVDMFPHTHHVENVALLERRG